MNGKILIASVLLLLAILIGCTQTGETGVNATASAEDLSKAGDLSKDQIKLTWVGPQKKIIPSIGIGVRFNVAKFADHQPGLDYSNDQMNLNVIQVSGKEMEAVANTTNSLEFITNEKGIPANPMLSYMYYDGKTETVTERILDAGEAKELAQKLQITLAGNEEAVQLLEAYK